MGLDDQYDDFPHSLIRVSSATASDKQLWDIELDIQLSIEEDNDIRIDYNGTYGTDTTGDMTSRYWVVFPTRTGGSETYVPPMDCEAK